MDITYVPIEQIIIEAPTINRDDLSTQQAAASSMVIEQSTTHRLFREQSMVWQVPNAPLSPEAEDRDASILQTVPMRAVERKRAVKRIRTFFFAVLLVSMLSIGALVTIIFIVPGPTYKAEILIVFLIAFSYVASVQMKRIERERQQGYLHVTQFVRMTKKRSMLAQSQDEDMKHFKLIKQDTTAYLRALRMRDLKKGSS